MDGDNDAILSADGHGALWLMGWGVGSPSMDYQFGWNTGMNYCVPEISSKKYQFTGIAGPEKGSSLGQRLRFDYISAKFFFQNGYGSEFSQLALADDGTKSLIKLTESFNIELVEDVRLEEGAMYVLTVDLTAGNTKGVVSLKKVADGEPEPAVVQTFLFDFGSNGTNTNRGVQTTNPDVRGNYWNNITNNDGNYAKAGTVYPALFNTANVPTAYAITLNSRFTTNGASGGGGLLDPHEEDLDELAIPSATGDYFFIESNEDNSNFTFSGLDKTKGYKFYAFGSRKANDVRTALYKVAGTNADEGELQIAGANSGGDGINQNMKNLFVSEPIYPDENGTITFTIARAAGSYIALNVLKIEEYDR